MIDEGVIKFRFSYEEETSEIPELEYGEVENCRKKLFALNLIGEYKEEKIGFGNLSVRKDYSDFHKSEFPQFLISGTQTGHLENLDGLAYTRVTDGSLEDQTIGYHGPVKASSESLTHGAVYLASEKIMAIVHVHNKRLWEFMLKGDFPRTRKSTSYGTKEMANEALEIISGKNQGCLVMHGHEDGVIFYGESIEEATKACLDLYLDLDSP